MANSDQHSEASPVDQLIEKFVTKKRHQIPIVEPSDPTIDVIRVPDNPEAQSTYNAYVCDSKTLERFSLLRIDPEPRYVVYSPRKRCLFVNVCLGDENCRSSRFKPFEFLLKYIHGDRQESVLGSTEAAIPILLLIHTLKLREHLIELETICTDEKLRELDKNSCLQVMLELRNLYKANELLNTGCKNVAEISPNVKRIYRGCFNLLLCHFRSLAACKEFSRLEADLVEKLVCHDMLNVSHEEQVRAAITLWSKGDPGKRTEIAAKMIERGVAEVEVNEIEEVFESCGLEFDAVGTDVDRPRVNPETVVFLGGGGMKDVKRTGPNDVSYYDQIADRVLKLTTIPTKDDRKLIGFSACVIGDVIWVSGGAYDLSSDWSTALYAFNTVTRHWVATASHNVLRENPRRHHGSCGDSDNLYMIGGFGKFRERQATVLVHRLRQRHLLESRGKPEVGIPNLPQAVTRPSCFCHKNRLFVLSGQMIYSFEKELRQWTRFKPACLGPCDVILTANSILLPNEPNLIVQIGIFGERKSMRVSDSSLSGYGVSGSSPMRWGAWFVYRWLPSRSQLLCAWDHCVYRVEGRIGRDREYEYSIHTSGVAHDDEILLVGEREREKDRSTDVLHDVLEADGCCAVLASVIGACVSE